MNAAPYLAALMRLESASLPSPADAAAAIRETERSLLSRFADLRPIFQDLGQASIAISEQPLEAWQLHLKHLVADAFWCRTFREGIVNTFVGIDVAPHAAVSTFARLERWCSGSAPLYAEGWVLDVAELVYPQPMPGAHARLLRTYCAFRHIDPRSET